MRKSLRMREAHNQQFEVLGLAGNLLTHSNIGMQKKVAGMDGGQFSREIHYTPLRYNMVRQYSTQQPDVQIV